MSDLKTMLDQKNKRISELNKQIDKQNKRIAKQNERIAKLEKLSFDLFKLLERCYIGGAFRKPSSGEMTRFHKRLRDLGVMQ